MRGDVLPFVSLWKGNSDRSLPSHKFGDGFLNLAFEQGHRFFWAGDKHWATVKTMKLWVLEIVFPFRDRMLKLHPQYKNTPMILYLDIYWCHRCDEFLDWLEKQPVKFFVIFVAANTTSVNQPCDVGLQRPVKHELRRQHMATAILETSAQLQSRLPGQVKLDTSLPHLRNQTPRWLYNTYNIVDQTDAAERSWARSCKTGFFNLSFDTLISPAMFSYLDNLKYMDPEFAKMLTQTNIRPALSGRKVLVEPIPSELRGHVKLKDIREPIGSLIPHYDSEYCYEDGLEIETSDLITLMNSEGGSNLSIYSPYQVNGLGGYYYSGPEESLDYGYMLEREGA